MEEALEAAATVLEYLGETVISSKCAELSALAEGVEQAAEAAGVQHEEISRLADELKQANERDRITAVVNLGDASAAMERVACAPLMALRDSTARLVQECQDFRNAYQGIENLRRAKAQRVRDRIGRPPGYGWLSIWRRFGARRGIRESLVTDIEKGSQSSKELEDSFAVTVDLLLTEGKLLKEKSGKLVGQVQNVTITADSAGVLNLCAELMRAMQAMEQANEADILTSVISLEAAATTMEGIVCSLPNVLRDRAAELVRACVELKRAHNAMATVQQAAAKQREARIAGAVGVAAASEPGQGDDKRVGMMGYGLFGSIGLIPYLGPDKVAKRIELLTDNWKLAIQIVVCVWWTAVALGAPCSAYAQSIYEQAYALFSSRLGILGMNAVVILFMYCVLDIDNIVALCCLLGIAIFLHALFFILTWCRGHF